MRSYHSKMYISMKNINPEHMLSSYRKCSADIINYGLAGLRINLKSPEMVGASKPFLQTIFGEKHPNVTRILDIPYPGTKIRGFLSNCERIDLKKGEKVIIQCKGTDISNEKNVIFIDASSFNVMKEISGRIYYGDGRGGFLIKEGSGKEIELSAMRDQHFYSTHAFHGCVNRRDGENIYKVIDSFNVMPELIALSFVESAEDIKDFRVNIKEQINVIAKIETMSGVNNILGICEEADMIMLARGDLAFEVPLNRFYNIEEKVIKSCKEMKTPLIIATDLLQSLENRVFPSRSDIIDFQHIISDVDYFNITGKLSESYLDTVLDVLSEME